MVLRSGGMAERITLKSLDRKIDATAGRLAGKIDASVERLDQKIDQKTDEGKQHTSLLFEATQTEIRALAENVASIGEQVDKMSGTLVRMDGRLAARDRDVDNLTIAYKSLDGRVTRLEDSPGR